VSSYSHMNNYKQLLQRIRSLPRKNDEASWKNLNEEFDGMKLPLDDFEVTRQDGTTVKPVEGRYFLDIIGACDVWTTREKVPRPLGKHADKTGYSIVCLTMNDGKATGITVHKIVAWAMYGPVPPGMSVDHIDRDRVNNMPWNLRYASRSDQIQNRVTYGLIPNLPFDMETDVLDGEVFYEFKPIEQKAHFLVSNMSRMVKVKELSTPLTRQKTLVHEIVSHRNADADDYVRHYFGKDTGNIYMHRLVMFLAGKLDDMRDTSVVVRHLDNDRHNYALSNLVIGTHSQNRQDALDSNSMKVTPCIMYAYNVNLPMGRGAELARFESYHDAERKTGIFSGQVRYVAIGKEIAANVKTPTVLHDGQECKVGKRVTFTIDADRKCELDTLRKNDKRKRHADHNKTRSNKPVVQKLDAVSREVIEEFATIAEAVANLKKNNNGKGNLHAALNNDKYTAGGFAWKVALPVLTEFLS